MKKVQSVLDLIGNTPILKLQHLDTGCCELFVKLENQNPGGSIKDRIALSMINAAEEEGRLKPGGTIIEATSGNTGISLALVAAFKGYKLIIVMPDKMSTEKISHLRAMGAEVRMTRSDVAKGHPEYYQDIAERLSKEIPNCFYIDQFNNPANPVAHEKTTAPEIWEQMEHRVDAVVAGVGSGGTITCMSRFFAKVSPKTKIILADPAGSILTDYIHSKKIGTAGSWFVEGIGEDFVPAIADLSRVGPAYYVSDAESFSTARELLQKEGIFGGSSTGTLVAAALRYCRESKIPQRVVTFIPDSGNKYLSKMYNDYWMADHGFIKRESRGDLRDFVARPHTNGATTFIRPDDTLMTAFFRMRLNDYSQLPVIENGRVVGIIDEYDLLVAVENDSAKYRASAKEYMAHDLKILQPNAPRAELTEILRSGKVGVLYSDTTFYGLITKTDVLYHLRRNMP